MNRTRALEHLGRLEESWGDLEAALARYEEALATGEAALREDAPVPYNRAYLVGALSRVGLLRQRLGRTAAAVEALDRALATARELGTRQLVADVLLDRGILARESGDLHAALASHEEALALAAEARLEVALARALGELGWDRLAGGDPAAALALFERALDSKAARESPEIAGRAALGDRAGPRAPRGDGPRRRAGRPGGGRDRVRAPGNAVRGAPPGLLAAAPGGLPQRDRPAAPAARRLGRASATRSGPSSSPSRRARAPCSTSSAGASCRSASEGDGRAWTVERLRAGLLAGDVGVVAFALDEPQSWAWVLTRDACAMAALPGRGEVERAATEPGDRRRRVGRVPYGRAARAEAVCGSHGAAALSSLAARARLACAAS